MSDKSRSVDAARYLLKRYEITDAPVPVEEIAKNLGATVSARPNSAEISGVLVRDGDSIVIGVNARDDLLRQRFTIAHELGHLRLHPGRPLHVDRSVLINSRMSGERGRGKGEEREANWFAAELLMPERLLRKEANGIAESGQVQNEDDLIDCLAAKFRVSKSAMRFRLLNLGLSSGI